MISRRSRSQEVSACNQVYFNLKFQASEIGFSRYTYGIIETELEQTLVLCLILCTLFVLSEKVLVYY